MFFTDRKYDLLKINRMRSAVHLLFLAFVLYLSGCWTDAAGDISFSGTWQESGLSPEHVNIIKASGTSAYAATNSDLFHRSLSEEPEWTPLGMKHVMEEGEWVRDFIVFGEAEILGGVGPARDRGSDYWENFVPFFYTPDGGQTWEPLENEFTENNAFFNRVTATPDLDTIYAIKGGNVIRSPDRGRSWTPIYWRSGSDKWESHTGSRFIVVDPQNTSNIWTGGMTIIMSPYVQISSDRGSTWERLTLSEGFIQGETRDIVINRNNSSHVLLAVGGVISSRDKGGSWEGSYHEAGILALENSLLHDRVVYASGVHPSGNVFIAVSPDFGNTWETIVYEQGPSDVVVNDLAVANIDGNEVVLFGTNQGVFSYKVYNQ